MKVKVKLFSPAQHSQCQVSSYFLSILQAFGASDEALQHFLGRGITIWGSVISGIIDDGKLLIQQARLTDASGLVSVLFEGNFRLHLLSIFL